MVKYGGKVHFLYDADQKERRKILAMLGMAATMVSEYFGRKCEFDVVICDDAWCMELQAASREHGKRHNIKYLALTDHNLREVIIRKDVAKFAQYIHEMIHSITPRRYTHQLREAIAYYFTFEILRNHPDLYPTHPPSADELYVRPLGSMVRTLGLDVVKRFAIGNAKIKESEVPKDAKDLFLPEHIFYRKKKFY